MFLCTENTRVKHMQVLQLVDLPLSIGPKLENSQGTPFVSGLNLGM